MLKTGLIIAVLTLVYVIFMLNSGKNEVVKREAYQWWFMPWFALLFVGLMYLLYNKGNFPDWPLIRNIYEEYKVEGIYFVLCAAVWTAAEYFLLRKNDLHEALIGTFRKLFAGRRVDKDQVLPFPYYLDAENNVHSKVGQVFYRWTMKLFVLLIALTYIVFFLLSAYAQKEFYPVSGLGLLGLIPLLDYYVYLCAQAPVEERIKEDGRKKNLSDFETLWKYYVSQFENYTLAWRRTLTEKKLAENRKARINDGDNIKFLFGEFAERHGDIIIQDWDLTSAFLELGPFFTHMEKNGRNVLVIFDIPNYSVVSGEKTYFEKIADKLQTVLKKDFFVYDGEANLDMLNNSVVLAPLSLISGQNLKREWIERIGLITVVNLFDKSISNLYECLRFSYVLQSLNPDYQIIFITPSRKGSQAALESIWIREEKSGPTLERRKKLVPSGQKQFFIGYNFEDYKERLQTMIIGNTAEPLFSGTELTIIALSSHFLEVGKVITPVRFLELSYSNVIEGIEELERYSHQLNSDICTVASADFNESVTYHLLPVTDRITEQQTFAILYDQENNAPSVYAKWQHLGNDENFSIVVSKPYLFRDYFNANQGFFMKSPFIPVQPSPSQSRVTLANVLLRKLKNSRIGEDELRNLLACYYPKEDIRSVPALIQELFSTYFSRNLAKNLSTKDMVLFDGMSYSHQIEYELHLDNDNDQYYLEPVTIKEKNTKNKLLVILRDLMEQNFAVGQTHSFLGRPYEIVEYNEATRTLLVSKNNKDVLFYKPHLSIAIGSSRSPIKGMNKKDNPPKEWRHRLTGQPLSIEFDGFETEVTVQTHEWFEFTKYTVSGYEKAKAQQKPRKYKNGKVLKVSMRYLQKPVYLERIDDIRKSLQLLLYEAMPSIFPHHAQYLIISSIDERNGLDNPEPLSWIFNHLIVNDTTEEGVLTYYFTEDAHIDLGLLGALSRKDTFLYILSKIYDYLMWLCEGKEENPENYDEYRYQKNIDKLAFLKYGTHALPPYLDIDLTINFIRDFFENDKDLAGNVSTRQIERDFIGACDFCGAKMKNSVMKRLDDGRMRCPDCSRGAVDTEEQFRDLCSKVKEAFLTHLHIDFSTIPHKAKFVSAVELHKMKGVEFSITNGYDVRILLGFARVAAGDDIFFVENGYKPDQTFGIIAHEMTHIWEYQDTDFQKVCSTNEDLVEGLAVWTDLFLSEKNGSTDVEERRAHWLARTDEYGRGLRFIMDHCPDDPYEYIRTEASKL